MSAPMPASDQVNAALELEVGDAAHVDHVKITGQGAGALHVSSLMATIGAHARFNAFLFTTGAAVVRNQLFVRFAGEGTIAGIRGASLLKGRQHADTTLVADHAVARLHQPRGVQVGARRREPRRLPRQDHRAAARAEDRRQDGDARAAAVGRGRGRQQARARDLRRRRAVRPRRDLRRSRRGSVVLSQGARHSGQGSRGAADPGVRRRGGRGDRARRPARRADGSVVAWLAART